MSAEEAYWAAEKAKKKTWSQDNKKHADSGGQDGEDMVEM